MLHATLPDLPKPLIQEHTPVYTQDHYDELGRYSLVKQYTLIYTLNQGIIHIPGVSEDLGWRNVAGSDDHSVLLRLVGCLRYRVQPLDGQDS